MAPVPQVLMGPRLAGQLVGRRQLSPVKTKPADARRLSAKELTNLRIRGVRAVQNGESPGTVAAVPGVLRVAVYPWLS